MILNMTKQNNKPLIYIIIIIIFFSDCKSKQNNTQEINIGNKEENANLPESQNTQHTLVEKTELERITIGNQIWSKNNLDVTHFRNGDLIIEARSNEEWINAERNKIPAWCYYNNDPVNGKTFGKLYNLYAINAMQELAPEGWHIPNQDEWSTMIKNLEKDEVGKVLKSTDGWLDNGNGNNMSDFSASPSGSRSPSGSFSTPGQEAWWWVSTKNVNPLPKPMFWGYRLLYNSNWLSPISGRFNFGMAIRCINDSQLLTNNYDQNLPVQDEEQTETNSLEEISIGEQTWATKNLEVSNFRNGDIIKHAKSLEEWKSAAESKTPAWCYYDNDLENGKLYGKLYNWYAVNDPRGLAPEGWHIPSSDEWDALSKFLQDNERMKNISGYKMKSKNGWRIKNTEGDNSSGFTGLPGGYRSFNYGFRQIGTNAVWWTATEDTYFGGAEAKSLCWCNGGINSDFDFLHKENGLSVRCIKD